MKQATWEADSSMTQACSVQLITTDGKRSVAANGRHALRSCSQLPLFNILRQVSPAFSCRALNVLLALSITLGLKFLEYHV